MTERFLRQALDEFEHEVEFYEAREAGLGDRFASEVEDALALAREYPGCGAPVSAVRSRSEVRAILLRSFPVRVVYVVRDHELIVVGIAHGKRRPGYWTDRLTRLG